MTAPSVAELSNRARDVFRRVVEGYLETGTPIGSRTISKLSGLGLSAASIRNVMQDLEELGLLTAPHTSAGRMPTETGLRLFVDGMMQASVLSVEERALIEAQVRWPSGGHAHVETTLEAATQALSGLSACAGIVLVPKGEPVIRQLAFVPLSQTQALAVLVGADGAVENRVIDLPTGLSATALMEAGNYVSSRLAGLTLPEAARRLQAEVAANRAAIDVAAEDVIARGIATWSEDGASRSVLIVRGQAQLLDQTAVGDIELIRLLDFARAGEGMKIFIGAENKLFALSGSSVIAAPYFAADGKVVGVVGVIGPTRLNYARVVPMVDYTAQALSRLMA
jgi:heat-inducible transcriptional repressor